MFNMFKGKEKTSEAIQAIKTMTDTIQHDANDYTDLATYLSGPRAVLNNLIIEACLGCKIEAGAKGGNKVTFNRPVPTMAEMSKMCSIVDNFVRLVEKPMIRNLVVAASTTENAAEGQQSSDMDVPSEFELMINGKPQARVRLVEGCNNKKLKAEIASQGWVTNALLDVNDIVALAAMGEDARKRSNRNKALIIGGVAILLTGTAVAGFMIYKKKKADKNAAIEANVEDGLPAVDLDSTDMPDVGMGDDSMPHVDLD